MLCFTTWRLDLVNVIKQQVGFTVYVASLSISTVTPTVHCDNAHFDKVIRFLYSVETFEDLKMYQLLFNVCFYKRSSQFESDIVMQTKV